MDTLPDEFFIKLDDETEKPFREWARENYDPGSEVSGVWHPVVRDECRKMNEEAGYE